jgi:hypothetical protein
VLVGAKRHPRPGAHLVRLHVLKVGTNAAPHPHAMRHPKVWQMKVERRGNVPGGDSPTTGNDTVAYPGLEARAGPDT